MEQGGTDSVLRIPTLWIAEQRAAYYILFDSIGHLFSLACLRPGERSMMRGLVKGLLKMGSVARLLDEE